MIERIKRLRDLTLKDVTKFLVEIVWGILYTWYWIYGVIFAGTGAVVMFSLVQESTEPVVRTLTPITNMNVKYSIIAWVSATPIVVVHIFKLWRVVPYAYSKVYPTE